LRALSSGGSVTSPPLSPALPKYKLADYRYGREEMLALYVKDNKIPLGLQDKEFLSILQEEPLPPLALVPFTEEEQVKWVLFYEREHTQNTLEEGVELVLCYLEAAINRTAAQVAGPPASEGEPQQPPASEGEPQQPPASEGEPQQPPASEGEPHQPPATRGDYTLLPPFVARRLHAASASSTARSCLCLLHQQRMNTWSLLPPPPPEELELPPPPEGEELQLTLPSPRDACLAPPGDACFSAPPGAACCQPCVAAGSTVAGSPPRGAAGHEEGGEVWRPPTSAAFPLPGVQRDEKLALLSARLLTALPVAAGQLVTLPTMNPLKSLFLARDFERDFWG
ncbi:UNVERIFIED_CONTAM: hypothetical protein FKN15_059734, partial [Acipenser sinensis]